ncbi:hypothetical protein ACYPKM_00440 [Pseudomonas aeruginosa]
MKVWVTTMYQDGRKKAVSGDPLFVEGELQMKDTYISRLARHAQQASLLGANDSNVLPPLADARIISITPSGMFLRGAEYHKDMEVAQEWFVRITAPAG